MSRHGIGLCTLLAVAAFAAAPAVASAETVSLVPASQTAPFGSTVHLAGVITPARQTQVQLFVLDSAAWVPVTSVQSGADGRFAFQVGATAPAVYLARTDAAESSQATVRVRPSLTGSVTGLAVVGAKLSVSGRLRPAAAGTLALIVNGRKRAVQLDPAGRFSATLSTSTARKLRVTLRLAPETGYATVKRQLAARVEAPVLGLGARSRAVRFLENRLRSLHFAIRNVDRSFGWDTREALFAFQKLHGLSRDGIASPRVWRALRRARVPRAGYPHGSHIEVDKARQVLFEVRRGKVVRIVHVSTGATGNTPIGRWHVYRKTPGFNSLSMYYSMYFLGGFALHGYHSVPPWPASHGCVRMPNWFAPGLYARWGYRTTVWVFPTTARGSRLWRPPAAIARTAAPRLVGRVGP
jgi:L,D-transpeptidase catalytic domain/Putative peptidoglycan binding domain